MDSDEPAEALKRAARYLDTIDRLYQYYGAVWGLDAAAVDAQFSPRQREFYYVQHLRRKTEEIDHQISAITRSVGAFFSKEHTIEFVSELYRDQTQQQSETGKAFPYDIFLPAWQIHLLVSHSVQYKITKDVVALLQSVNIPPERLTQAITLRHSRDVQGFMVSGWFTDWEYIQALTQVLGQEMVSAHHQEFLECAQRFLHLATAVWTPQRASAYLDESDIIRRRAAASAFLWHQWNDLLKIGKPMTLDVLSLWRQVEVRQETLTAPAWFVNSLHLKGTESQRQDTANSAWQKRLGNETVKILREELHELMGTIKKEIEA